VGANTFSRIPLTSTNTDQLSNSGPTAPLPGAFSLASTPVPQPAVEVHELDDAADGSRRSLFSRGG
jgi:hypothetical protein